MGRFAPIAVGLSGFWMVFLGAANAMSLRKTTGSNPKWPILKPPAWLEC
jgi:hypothetical protein